MDSSTSQTIPVLEDIYDLFSKLDDSNDSPQCNQRHTVIKFTKIPDQDNVSTIIYQRSIADDQPRFRRVVTVNNNEVNSPRSLRSGYMYPKLTSGVCSCKRKIATIEEEIPSQPISGKDAIRPSSYKMLNKAMATDKIQQRKINTRLSGKDINLGNKTNVSKKETKITKPNNNKANDSIVKDKEPIRSNRSLPSNYRNIHKKNDKPTEQERKKEVLLLKNEVLGTLKAPLSVTTPKKAMPIRNYNTVPSKVKLGILPRDLYNSKKVNLIHVPLENTEPKKPVPLEHTETKKSVPLEKTEIKKSQNSLSIDVNKSSTELVYPQIKDCSTEIDQLIIHKNVGIGTDPIPETVSRDVETVKVVLADAECSSQYENVNANVETSGDVAVKVLEDLLIPNVKLTNKLTNTHKSVEVANDKIFNMLKSNSLPNAKLCSLTSTESKENADPYTLNYTKQSCIVGRATVTYTTRQKIDFKVVENNNTIIHSSASPSTMYPLNIVSVLTKEISQKKCNTTKELTEKIPKMFFNQFNRNELVKPSDIIKSMSKSGDLLRNDFISEQFHKELSFIDTFFESMQYLDNCSLVKKTLTRDIDKAFSYAIDSSATKADNLLSKFNNNTTCIESGNQTNSSKSLCLLNSLINDERRRAKNLLFVLKMREDALKDFTKSQILWLENKKKLDNSDISTLKKKQRGVLLKLQHECGEMQRMRKALLTLSKKRKAALMKTKRNIELLKLSDRSGIDKILSDGKRKIKKSSLPERNVAPLKCFELSTSSCEEKITSQNSFDSLPNMEDNIVSCAEKSIQTGESILGTLLIDASVDTAAENFVIVEGKYLNVLFHNLTIPSIFSNDKQYEVNIEALRNILNSSDILKNNMADEVIEKLMDRIKGSDNTSSPSTARSLVEEFDEYYRGLGHNSKDNSFSEEDDLEFESNEIDVRREVVEQIFSTLCDNRVSEHVEKDEPNVSKINIDIDDKVFDVPLECTCASSRNTGEADELDRINNVNVTVEILDTSPKSQQQDENDMSLVKHDRAPAEMSDSVSSDELVEMDNVDVYSDTKKASTTAACEAEELRRQQLAVEREIKALQQQQCQLLVVREIPDKPPPPYTPPADSRHLKSVRRFTPDENFENKVIRLLQETNANLYIDGNDCFDDFIKDFCTESIDRESCQQSDKPWDAYNLLPKRDEDVELAIRKRTTDNLREILNGATKSNAALLASRRMNHIEDILFDQWNRSDEPEWTSSHMDEVAVKNQVFESIFQQILTETIDIYKEMVLKPK